MLSKIRLAKPFDIVAELARHRQGRLDTIQSSGVEREQFLHQQVGRKSVGDDVVQLQHQPVAVVAQRIKVCLEQGAARQIERRAGMFVQRVGQFLFGVLHAGQIDMAQAGLTQRLKWQDTLTVASNDAAQRIVPAHQGPYRSGQRGRLHGTIQTKHGADVVGHRAFGRQLCQQGKLTLCRRKRNDRRDTCNCRRRLAAWRQEAAGTHLADA